MNSKTVFLKAHNRFCLSSYYAIELNLKPGVDLHAAPGILLKNVILMSPTYANYYQVDYLSLVAVLSFQKIASKAKTTVT